MNRFASWLRWITGKGTIAVCLGAILCVAVALSVHSVRGDISLRGMDTGNHLLFSVEYFYLFKDIVSKPSLNLLEKTVQSTELLGEVLVQEGIKHSNFVYFTTSVAYMLFGQSLYVAKMSMLLYVGILLAAVYLLAKMLTGSRTAGVAAACILYLYPLIFESSRQFGVDLPLTALVTLSLYFLLRHRDFQSRGRTVILGVVAGIGVQVKPQFVLYFALPFAIVAASALASAARNRSLPELKRMAGNLCIFLVITVGISSLWFLPRRGWIWYNFLFHRNPFGIVEHMSVIRRLMLNVSQLAQFALGLPAFCMFLISALAFWRRGPHDRLVYAAWLGAPFIVFTFIFVYSAQRYFMPVLPVMAIITSWYIFRIRTPVVRGLVLGGTAVFLCLQFSVLTLGNSTVRAGMARTIRTSGEQLTRTTLKTPYAFVGWTEYGDTTVPVGYQRISGLLECIKERMPLDRDNYLLFIVMSPEGFQPQFDIRYYFRSWSRRAELLDLTLMTDMVRWVMENSAFDYVIMKLPYGYHARWPERKEFDRMYAGSMSVAETGLFKRHLYRYKLVDALYASRTQYELRAVIPIDHLYQLAVFSRQRRDVDAAAPERGGQENPGADRARI